MEILLAEDNPVSLKLLSKLVEQIGHKPVLANDGQKAWDIFRREKMKMVITDWEMPSMDGPTLCSNIRGLKLKTYTYIIIVTSRDQSKDAIKGLKAGANDYITKPFEAEELKARVRAAEHIIKLEDEQINANTQLLQAEKMASIGQLAAGVAHEINNPTGFVSSNLKSLGEYYDDISKMIAMYRDLIGKISNKSDGTDLAGLLNDQFDKIVAFEKDIDIDYLMEDIPELISDCREGVSRIKNIVINLKDFAHPGEEKIKATDINHGIDSTLNVVWNELKYKATINKNYQKLPLVKCYPQQVNQIFMNILVNAAQAIQEQGEISISTKASEDNERVIISISDTGAGIKEENIKKIFDPFFTTKKIGQGTGLGMNVVYKIVQKHNGTINVESTLGKGTTFIIEIPVEFNKPDSGETNA